MSHHLGNAFRADTCRNQKRAEAVSGLMVGEVLLPPDDDTEFVYLKPHHVSARQWENRLRVISRIVQIKYLLRYRMQGNEGLYFRLLAIDANVSPVVGSPPDMVRIKQQGINISKSRKAGEDKSPASQFLQRVIGGQFQIQQLFQFSPADMHPLGGRFFLILQLFQRIGTYNLMVYGKVHQPVQPAEAMVGLRCSEVLVSLQVNLVFPSEFLCDVRKGNIRVAFRVQELTDIALVIPRTPVGRSGVDFLGTEGKAFPFPFSHLEQMGRNDRLTCYPVFQQFGTDHTLLFEHFIIEPLRMFAELFQAVVRPHVRGLRLLGIPLFGIAGDTRGYNCTFFPSMEIRQSTAVVPSARTLFRLMYNNKENVLRMVVSLFFDFHSVFYMSVCL